MSRQVMSGHVPAFADDMESINGLPRIIPLALQALEHGDEFLAQFEPIGAGAGCDLL